MQPAKTRNSTATTTETPPPQRTSPSKVKAARQLKISGPDSSDGGVTGVPSPNQASKKPKEGSPRIIERKSPRAPAAALSTEKKRLTKVSELESQLSQIQEELKKAKDQLNLSESTKKQAQQEAEDAQKKLSESQKQLMDLSTSEEARLQELRKISQERDQAWQAELEAVQKQHSMDSAALNSSLNEIQKLKFQLERVSESEASHARHAESAHADIQNLRHELSETLALVEKLKTQVSNFNESENQSLESLNRTRMQLAVAKMTEETLQSEVDRTVKTCKALSLEFDQSKARVHSLEELVSKLQSDIPKEDGEEEKEESEDVNQLKSELNEAKTAMEAAERRYQEECIKSTLQIKSAYELIERTRESELETKNERVQAWQSELEAVQKQHSMDSAALNSSLIEIQKLKFQLERVSESEASPESAYADIQNLRHELTETLALVEKLKTQISNVNESENQTLELLNRTRMQLAVAKKTEESLQSEVDRTMKAFKALSLEFDQSNARVHSLEELVSKLQSDIPKEEDDKEAKEESEDVNQLKAELTKAKTAMEAAERRYQEECIKSTVQIKSAYELIELTKSESSTRESELEEKLKKVGNELEELKYDKQMKKEENIEQNLISERESNMERELKKLGLDIEDLKANLMDKETELQSIMEENESLKREMEETKANNEAFALAEASMAAERDGLMIKVGSLAEEADKSNRKAARTCEQLEATQVANLELEAELRKLKVQSDQWRKAAEAAAAMISSTGNNGRFVERTGSLNSNYNNNIGGGKKMTGLPDYEEEMEDESPKKKNGNMLKKIGVLLKKGGQK